MKKLATLIGVASLGLGAATLAADGTQPFAQDLWKQLGQNTDENVVYSPFSIAQVLDLARQGAKGATRAELDATLQGELASLEDQNVAVSTHVWADARIKMHDGFNVKRVDFEDPEAARQKINGRIARQTRQHIQDLLPKGSIDRDTRLVLTNAVYLDAKWAQPFKSSGTGDASFTRLDGSKEKVRMMHAKLYSPARYGEKEGVQVVELPYKGGSLVFDAILPKDMKTYSLDLEGALSLLQPATVEVALPRFEVEQKSELGDALVALGVKTAFTDAADFSGFTSDCPLKISRVISRTTVRVDEEGTVAAAATVATMSCGAAPHREKVYSIVCDRPFFFAIRDAKTGVVAFFGRVTKPGSQRAK